MLAAGVVVIEAPALRLTSTPARLLLCRCSCTTQLALSSHASNASGGAAMHWLRRQQLGRVPIAEAALMLLLPCWQLSTFMAFGYSRLASTVFGSRSLERTLC